MFFQLRSVNRDDSIIASCTRVQDAGLYLCIWSSNVSDDSQQYVAFNSVGYVYNVSTRADVSSVNLPGKYCRDFFTL